MKRLNNLENISAGSRATAIIGGITCAASLFTVVTAIIFAPTCLAMIGATIYD